MKIMEAGKSSAVILVIFLISAVAAYGALAQSQSRSPHADEIEAQISRADLAGRMRDRLGDDFAGVWFDQSTAQMHVGVTSEASRLLAEEVAARAGLAESVVETPVNSTWAELETTQAHLSRQLEDLLERSEAKTALAAEANAVYVELASTVSRSRRGALERQVSGGSVDVLIDVSSDPSFEWRQGKQCAQFAQFKAYCDRDIVAGVRIEHETANCTAGPAVVLKDRSSADKATATYLLTAGHCVEGGGEKKWYAINKEGPPEGKKELGKGGAFLNGETDAGVIELNTTYWATANTAIPVVPKYAVWSTKEETDPVGVQNEADPMEGVNTCFSGQRSGKNCGTITTTDAEVKFKGAAVVTKNLAEVELNPVSKGGEGDSGAPFYTENNPGAIEGIWIGYTPKEPGSPEGYVVYLHAFTLALEKLEKEKGLALELLDKANEKRKHPVFTGPKYPITFSAKTSSSEDQFTAFGSTIKCGENEFHGEVTEAQHAETPAVVEIAPTYKTCTSSGVATTFTDNGCKYKFTLSEEVSEDAYSATADIVCPAGKAGIQFDVGAICTVTLPPQSGLKVPTLTNSEKNIVLDTGTIEGVKAQKQGLCGTSETSTAVYDVNKAVTVSGTGGEEAIEIDMGGE